MPSPRTEPPHSEAGGHWYQQPILWLGVVVFVASMAGCAWIIVAGARSADIPLETSHTVFGVPATARSSHAPAPPR
ncbi:MAG: hypothetical protein BGP10_06060 [Rhodanobacter sp. 68-29]|nr:hypothetical protein [Rhodanobacter sp.]ODU74045.1 MAG: hypothetical protein ABT17_09295 [Rhodanobacter sp. SCN 69-32]OJY55402.1 MAG: hypothetical protein BGP10_06060 [Rhodanobacter sp. 68-29]